MAKQHPLKNRNSDLVLLNSFAANSALSHLLKPGIGGFWVLACRVEIAQIEGTQNKERIRHRTKTANSEIAKMGWSRDSRASMSTSRASKSVSADSRPAVGGGPLGGWGLLVRS